MTDPGNGVGATASLGSSIHPPREPSSWGPVCCSVSEWGKAACSREAGGLLRMRRLYFLRGWSGQGGRGSGQSVCRHTRGQGSPARSRLAWLCFGAPCRGRVGDIFHPARWVKPQGASLLCLLPVKPWTLHLGCFSCFLSDITLVASSLSKSDSGPAVVDSPSSPLSPLLSALLRGSGASPPVGCIGQVLAAGAWVYVAGRRQLRAFTPSPRARQASAGQGSGSAQPRCLLHHLSRAEGSVGPPGLGLETAVRSYRPLSASRYLRLPQLCAHTCKHCFPYTPLHLNLGNRCKY